MKTGLESSQGERTTKPELFDMEAFTAELLRLYDKYVDAAKNAGMYTGRHEGNITPQERKIWEEKRNELYIRLVTEVSLALRENLDGGTVVEATERMFFEYREGRRDFLGDMSDVSARAKFWADVAVEVARMARTEKRG